MTQYIENTLKLINKENNFDKSNSKLVLEHYEDLIDFSAIYFNCYDKVKKLNLDKGFKAELDKELKKQSSEFYQVVKKCTPNHLTAMRKLGKNPLSAKKVVKDKIADCKLRKNQLSLHLLEVWGIYLIPHQLKKLLRKLFKSFLNQLLKSLIVQIRKLLIQSRKFFKPILMLRKLKMNKLSNYLKLKKKLQRICNW